MEKQNSRELDEEEFDSHVRHFLKTIDGIFQYKENDKFDLSGDGPSLIRIQFINYKKAYEKHTKPFEHVPFFLKFFEDNSSHLLKKPFDDSWLKKGTSVFIRFGENENKNPKKRIKILLSSIYTDASKIAERSQKLLEKTNDEEFDKHKEILFPEILILSLYRILSYCVAEEHRENIIEHISSIEEDLGIKNKEKVDVPPDFSNGLVSMANSMLKNIGLKPPPGSEKNFDIGSMMSKIMNNEVIMNATKDVASGDLSKINFNSIMQEITKDFNLSSSSNSTVESLDFLEKSDPIEIPEKSINDAPLIEFSD